MSAHLQFGPEWMRKGPGKTSSAVGSTAGNNSNISENTAPVTEALTPLSPAKASSAKPGKVSNRRNPSLSNLSASNAMLGPAPVTPSVTTPLAGGFSFAAAAAQAGAPKESTSASSTSAALPLSSDGDSARYSMRLLSLYSSERGGKNATAAPSNDAPPPISPNASQKKKPVTSSMSGGSLSERESRRTTSIGHDFFTPPRPHSPNGEARGLNARSSLEKMARPGLFQRGSAGTPNTSAPPPVVSPNQLFHAKERDRHGVGIQGGVLAGVVSPPTTTRRRKESEVGFDLLRSPRDVEHTTAEQQQNQPQQQQQQQQLQYSPLHNKRQIDAFTSARNRNSRTTTFDASTMDGAVGSVTNASNATSNNGEILLRREPIGPPADHSGGFAKFSGYEKKRERQASGMNHHRYSSGMSTTAARTSRGDREASLEGEGQSSGDVDLAKHATYVLDSLKLDADDEEHLYQGQQQSVPQPHQAEWSPSEQQWYYRDPSGQVQGPFQADVMQQWFEANYFRDDLLVRRVEEEEYKTLHEMKLYIGNDVSPFLVAPSEYVGRSQMVRFPSFEQPSVGHQSPFSHHPVTQPTGWLNNQESAIYRNAAPLGGSSHSSPFTTPQISLAELENNPQMRAQYAEMIRQREMAEYRAKQEQQAAQMAAIAMAQAQGRDPATLGIWPSNNAMNSPWGGQQPINGFYNSGDINMNLWQQQQYQQQTQSPQHQYNQYDSQPSYQQQGHQQGQQGVMQQEEMHASQQQDHQYQPEADQQVIEEIHSGLEASLKEAETIEEGAAASVEEAEATLQEESNDPVESLQEVQEQTPEEAWPQSPSAVEFASEPLMTDEQWTKEESPTRGKKSRRDRTKQKGEDDVKTDRLSKQQQSSSYSSGNLKTMTEEQFRSTQNAAKDANGSTQAPLSNWLPDVTSPSSATAAKAAPWANQQDASTAGMSLRQIQEAEAKRAEAKRASKPRLQLHTTNTSEPTTLPTTMTWGLAGSHSSNAPREVTGASPSPAAWTAQQASKKKTLMEIQEEEKARAKKVKDAQAASNVARSKAYADLASKMQGGLPNPMSNSTSGGSWNVVGASGKAAPASVAATSRSVKPAVASPIVPRIASNGLPSALSNGRTTTSRISSTKASDGSPAPSPEFIKHCKDQLKGLNVKVDDFIEMLLSFPLDPSPDVIDIIAESIYASSSTLDGRRFASDFVAKRKLDAAQGKGGIRGGVLSSNIANGPIKSTSTLRSASDILKSTPAAASTNDGFGGFKVVKPKGAKKRA